MFPSLICRANQLTGFYTMGTLAVKGLIYVYNIEIAVLINAYSRERKN